MKEFSFSTLTCESKKISEGRQCTEVRIPNTSYFIATAILLAVLMEWQRYIYQN